MAVEVAIEGGKAKIKTQDGTTIEMPEAEFYQKHPELAGSHMSSRRLAQLDINAMFGPELHPVTPGPIGYGDRVMVKASKEFGEVVREVGDSFRVTMSDGRIQTYWALELEKR